MKSLLFLSLLTAKACADGTYRSRPDLAPPHLNITIPCQSGSCEQGYLFVAPFTSYGEPDDRGSLQTAPYILTDAGDLVWSGLGYFSGWVCNLQAARWQGRDVLFAFEGVHNGRHGHGHGHHTLLSQNYDVVRELRAGGHLVSDKHEFAVVDEKTALIQIYQPVQRDLTLYGGDASQTWIVDARFQELDIATGKVLFEWSSLDHTTPDETALPLTSGLAGLGYNSSTAWDYFHINSVAKGADGHYLVSARHASTIFKINGTDGTIIWRFGGTSSDFALDPDAVFGFQHHARYVSVGVSDSDSGVDLISLFDNSVYGSESAGGGKDIRIHPFSRGKYFSLDHKAKQATLVQSLEPPSELGYGGKPILTRSQGSLQALPNGGSLVNWGSEGQLTEYDARGDPVFHAFLGGGHFLSDKVQNYRAFRFNWTGISPETPAVVAEVDGDDSTTIRVHVSWNGDTLTQAWRFSWREVAVALPAETQQGALKQKLVARQGFETSCSFHRPQNMEITSVVAEALDSNGHTLASSAVELNTAARRKLEKLVKQAVEEL